MERERKNSHGMTAAEEKRVIKMVGRVYGLNQAQAAKFVRHPQHKRILNDLDEWRARHGYPAKNAPLTRGKLLEMLGLRGRRRPVMAPNPKQKITLYANPYDITAKGWYFDDAEDFEKKFEKHLPVEEYEIEWIEGPEEDRELFEALNVTQATLSDFFELIDELWEWEKAALYFLLRVQGEEVRSEKDLEELVEKVRDEVRVREGSSKEYVYDMIDDMGGVEMAFGKQNAQQYFDFERFGRDIRHDLDDDDPRSDLDDEELGEEYVDDIGGVGELGEMAEQYFDVESFARDMEYNGELHEFDFAGTTFTTDYMG